MKDKWECDVLLSEQEHERNLKEKSLVVGATIVGLVAALGGFLYGYNSALANSVLEMEFVKRKFSNNSEFTTLERALITAVLSLGSFLGALIAPFLSNKYGRKKIIIATTAIVFTAGNSMMIAATTWKLFCGSRFISGVAVGILSVLVPIYQGEAAPKWVRGGIVFTYQWAITWGLLIASAICQGTQKVDRLISYRLPVGLQYLWSMFLCLGVLFLPESPRFHVTQGNLEKALICLSQLRRLPLDDDDLIEEIVEIKANYDYEMSFGRISYLDCFRSGAGRCKQPIRMATGMGVQAFQQCSGINFIFYYGVVFFSKALITNSYLMSFVTYVINTVFSIPGILLVDVIGRRRLLIFGGSGMCICNLVVSIAGATVSDVSKSGIVCLVFVNLFIAFFASSWGGAVWALSSELYSVSIRHKAMSLNAATNWLANFICAFASPYVDKKTSNNQLKTNIMFLWTGCNFFSVVFAYFFVYETKGLRLEEIDCMYQECPSARVSSGFQPRRHIVDADANQMFHDYVSPPINTNNLTIVPYLLMPEDDNPAVPEPIQKSSEFEGSVSHIEKSDTNDICSSSSSA